MTVFLWLTAAWFIGTTARTAAANFTVEIKDFGFSPQTLTIDASDTVTWIQKDAVVHSSVSDTGVWSGPPMSLNQTFAFTFDNPGTFPYHSEPFTTVAGTIIVRAPDLAPQVTLVNPKTNSQFDIGAPLPFEAVASDNGSVVRVEFYSGIVLLEAMDAAPFTFTRAGFDAGSYTFHAVATDDSGKRGTSAPVVVTISGAIPQPKFAFIEIFPDRSVFLNVSAIAGKTHVVEAAANLTGWEPIHTNTPAADSYSFLDKQAATLPKRSYRLYHR